MKKFKFSAPVDAVNSQRVMVRMRCREAAKQAGAEPIKDGVPFKVKIDFVTRFPKREDDLLEESLNALSVFLGRRSNAHSCSFAQPYWYESKQEKITDLKWSARKPREGERPHTDFEVTVG